MTHMFPNTGYCTRTDPPSNAFDAASPAAQAHVRYVGFEGIAGGRRLRFSVKSLGQPANEVTFDIPDTLFTGTAGVSIQDAAPMAYEKLVELLATEHACEATLFLTAADVTNYITRHDSHKRGHSRSDTTKATDVAA